MDRTVFLYQQSKIKFNFTATNLTCYEIKEIVFDDNTMKLFKGFDFSLYIISIIYGVFHFAVSSSAVIGIISLCYGYDHLVILPVIASGLAFIPDIISFAFLVNAHLKLEPFVLLILNIQNNRCFYDNSFLAFSTLYNTLYYEYILSAAIFICSMLMIFPLIFICYISLQDLDDY